MTKKKKTKQKTKKVKAKKEKKAKPKKPEPECQRCKGPCSGDFDGVRIFYPLPSMKLSANQITKQNHIKLSKLIAEYRLLGRVKAQEAACNHEPYWKSARIDATFYVGDARNFQDTDNLWFWIKRYRDGIQDAGLVTDDRVIVLGDLHQVQAKKICEVVILIRNNTRPLMPERKPESNWQETVKKATKKHNAKVRKKKGKKKTTELTWMDGMKTKVIDVL